jgi:Skp family chaperone for outer membrane proteins
MITESKAALYYPSSVDITSQVIAAYDKAHP